MYSLATIEKARGIREGIFPVQLQDILKASLRVLGWLNGYVLVVLVLLTMRSPADVSYRVETLRTNKDRSCVATILSGGWTSPLTRLTSGLR
jgi:hypothetical protein